MPDWQGDGGMFLPCLDPDDSFGIFPGVHGKSRVDLTAPQGTIQLKERHVVDTDFRCGFLLPAERHKPRQLRRNKTIGQADAQLALESS